MVTKRENQDKCYGPLKRLKLKKTMKYPIYPKNQYQIFYII